MLRERIVVARDLQERLKGFAADAEHAAVVLYADDESLSIHGNEAGLLRLASELIEVASGGQVSPSASEWLDADWLPLEAIVLDPSPKREITRPSFFSRVATSGIFIIVLIGFVVVLGVGGITVLNWIERHLHF